MKDLRTLVKLAEWPHKTPLPVNAKRRLRTAWKALEAGREPGRKGRPMIAIENQARTVKHRLGLEKREFRRAMLSWPVDYNESQPTKIAL